MFTTFDSRSPLNLFHARFRLSAEYGGTFLLNRAVEEIVMDNGKVQAVRSEGKVKQMKDLDRVGA